jgi:hypothetical protein
MSKCSRRTIPVNLSLTIPLVRMRDFNDDETNVIDVNMQTGKVKGKVVPVLN